MNDREKWIKEESERQQKYQFDGANVGKLIKVHYIAKTEDDVEFENSYKRKKPIEFVCGIGQMIMGFDYGCANLKEGDRSEIRVHYQMAYGPRTDRAILTEDIASIPGAEDMKIGDKLLLANEEGQQFPAEVIEKTDTSITFDANHPLAGKNLIFEVEMLSIKDLKQEKPYEA